MVVLFTELYDGLVHTTLFDGQYLLCCHVPIVSTGRIRASYVHSTLNSVLILPRLADFCRAISRCRRSTDNVNEWMNEWMNEWTRWSASILLHFTSGAVLALARWGRGQWGHNSSWRGRGATICSWIKDLLVYFAAELRILLVYLYRWKSRETGPKWGGGHWGPHFSLGGRGPSGTPP